MEIGVLLGAVVAIILSFVVAQTGAQTVGSSSDATLTTSALKGPGMQAAAPTVQAAASPRPGDPTATTAKPAPLNVQQAAAAQTAAELRADVNKWRLTVREAAAIGHPKMAGKMSICISPYTPDVFCDAQNPPSTYTGYGVAVFDQIAKRVPWLRDASAWEYRCMDWSKMEADLRNVGGRGCMLGLMMNPPKNDEWIATRAINQDGLQILTRMKRGGGPKDLFSPFAAFTWQLWLMLFGTAFAVAIVLWVFDVIAKSLIRGEGGKDAPEVEEDEDGDKVKRSKPEAVAPEPAKDPETGDKANGKDGDLSTKEATDAAKEPGKSTAGRRFLHAMGVEPGKEGKALQRLDENLRNAALHLARAGKPPFGVTLPAQIVLWAWGLTSMICLSLYTGATAALMTTSSLTGGINDRSDLPGKAVGTWTDYVDRLKDAGIPAFGYRWDNDEDEAVMIEDLRRGKIAALVMDYNFVQYQDGQNCDLASAGDSFLLNDIGISINKAVPQLMVDAINGAIISLVETGDMEQLREIHVKGLGGKCSAANFRVQKSNAVRVSQVLGLWVVLGLATMTGAMLLFCLYVVKKKRAAAAAQALMQVARTLSKPFMGPPRPADSAALVKGHDPHRTV